MSLALKSEASREGASGIFSSDVVIAAVGDEDDADVDLIDDPVPHMD